MPRGPDVGHDIDVPNPLPAIIGGLSPSTDTDPGIGAEEIDGSDVGLDGLDQILDIDFLGDINSHRDATDFLSHSSCTFEVAIGADDGLGTFGHKTASKRSTNAAGRPGDHDDAIVQFHETRLP